MMVVFLRPMNIITNNNLKPVDYEPIFEINKNGGNLPGMDWITFNNKCSTIQIMAMGKTAG